MKTGAIIQARMGSTRLPGKVMMRVLGFPLLHYLLERLREAKKLDQIVVATTDRKEDQVIADCAIEHGIEVFRGSEKDVLDRYYQAAKNLALENIVRITADCPLLDGQVLDNFVSTFFEEPGLDYMVTAQTFPEGYDMEIFTFAALEKAWTSAKRSVQREHVTPYIRNHSELFKLKRLDCPKGDLSWVRITVDEPEDFEVVKAIIEHFYPTKSAFYLDDIITFMSEIRPDLFNLNRNVVRNEGYLKSLKEEAEK